MDAVLQARRELLREREKAEEIEKKLLSKLFWGESEEYAEGSRAAIREGKRRKRERGEGD